MSKKWQLIFLTALANRAKADGKKERASVQLISIFERSVMKRKKLPFTLMLAALACMTSAGTTFADEHTWTRTLTKVRWSI